MNFNRWYGIAVLACIMFWLMMFSLFKGCCEQAQAREAGPGFYVEVGQSLTPVQNYYADYEGNRFNYISYTDINLHYTFSFWNIQLTPFTSIKTWAVPSITQLNGKPFCDIYTIGCEVVWNRISIIIDHYCAHAVFSTSELWQTKDYRMGQNMNEIKIRYSFN